MLENTNLFAYAGFAVVLVAAATIIWWTRSRLHRIEKSHAEVSAVVRAADQRLAERDERIAALTVELAAERDLARQEQAKGGEIQQQARAFEVRAQQCEENLLELKRTLVAREEDNRVLQERFAQLDTEHARLKTSLEEKQRHFEDQLRLLEQNKHQLKVEFENLANRIFETKGKAFTESSRQSLDGLLAPFKRQIEEFKKQAEDIHHKDTQQQAHLRAELGQLKELNKQITEEAHALATALKGQKKMQGNWGELVLENVLERSGLVEGRDYRREVALAREDGGRSRPDAIVYLPQNKHLVIDAKVSLNAYTRYVNSEDEAERSVALKEHIDAVAARIRELSERDYHDLPGLNSPEIVFMFIPIESAFVEALKADETLFLRAIEQNVLIATPTTLLTSLNIVRQLWRYEDQNKHTAELAKKADGVFKKLNTFLASFQNIKNGLEKAHEAYDRAEGQLLSGKGNLVKQVSEFKKLAPAIRHELPEYFTDRADLEIDLISDRTSKIDVDSDESETEGK
ncbi:MAG TPA: DNA recombination protein RmuC [Porticoccaceae bacterium]|nr:DNA recombination protein RmuC [Porticoccaceae bacterium]